jgi:serine/threonine protein kinase
MPTEDPVELLLDRWDSALGADPQADLDVFIGAEGSQLDDTQRARFRSRAEALARINRNLGNAVALSSGPFPGSDSSRPNDSGPSDFTPGMQPVPGYTLDSRIGKGGFGEVWRATGPGGMPVALKIISRRGETRRTELKSLENIKGVRHPHLLAVTAYWEHGDRLFIASELADGTLLGRLQQVKDGGGTGIPVDELLQYITEAAEGIDFLNSPQSARPAMQHADIKPQNLLLMSGSVKVGDYGLIRPLSGIEAEHHGTMTLQYAAPEFLDGKLSAASDQFSLAVTYCCLRTGRLPFGGTLLEYRDAIRSGRADLSGLPPAESAVVRRALAVAPKDRFPSCSAFVDELKASLAAQVVRGRLTWPTTAGFVVAGFALLAVSLWLAGINRDTGPQANTSPETLQGNTPTAGEPRPRIAVLPFEHFVPDAKDPTGIRNGVGRVMTTRLEQSGLFDVVERARLQAVLAELDLSQSSKFDPAETNRIGKLLGARQLVLGSIFMFGKKLRMDASFVDTETGRVICSEGSDGPPDEVEAITRALCDALIARHKKTE